LSLFWQVIRSMQWDILSLLNGYAHELYKNDPHWHRHISNLDELKLSYPRKWRQHPVRAWNTTIIM
jgi:hypothetical protein